MMMVNHGNMVINGNNMCNDDGNDDNYVNLVNHEITRLHFILTYIVIGDNG